MSDPNFSPTIVKHIATLANIPITEAEEPKLAQAFSDTIKVVAHMSELDTSQTEPTHQVTGLENIWREDLVDDKHMFTQDQALAGTANSYQGYFKVPQIIDQE